MNLLYNIYFGLGDWNTKHLFWSNLFHTMKTCEFQIK